VAQLLRLRRLACAAPQANTARVRGGMPHRHPVPPCERVPSQPEPAPRDPARSALALAVDKVEEADADDRGRRGASRTLAYIGKPERELEKEAARQNGGPPPCAEAFSLASKRIPPQPHRLSCTQGYPQKEGNLTLVERKLGRWCPAHSHGGARLRGGCGEIERNTRRGCEQWVRECVRAADTAVRPEHLLRAVLRQRRFVARAGRCLLLARPGFLSPTGQLESQQL
jgi:hypothetical protein